MDPYRIGLRSAQAKDANDVPFARNLIRAILLKSPQHSSRHLMDHTPLIGILDVAVAFAILETDQFVRDTSVHPQRIGVKALCVAYTLDPYVVYVRGIGIFSIIETVDVIETSLFPCKLLLLDFGNDK